MFQTKSFEESNFYEKTVIRKWAQSRILGVGIREEAKKDFFINGKNDSSVSEREGCATVIGGGFLSMWIK